MYFGHVELFPFGETGACGENEHVSVEDTSTAWLGNCLQQEDQTQPIQQIVQSPDTSR